MLAAVRRHREATGENLFDQRLARSGRGSGWSWPGSTGRRSCPRPRGGRSRCTCTRTGRRPDLPALDEAQRAGFGLVYLDLLARLDALYDEPLPYVAAWQQAPVRVEDGRDDARLHLRLHTVRRAPNKIKYLAGSETGAGAFISDVLPEAVAERLRSIR